MKNLTFSDMKRKFNEEDKQRLQWWITGFDPLFQNVKAENLQAVTTIDFSSFGENKDIMLDSFREFNAGGVVYPANFEESDMAFTLWKNIYQQKNHDDYIERFRELLSDNMLASGVTDDEIDRFFDYCQPMREFHEGWAEIDDGNITVYITSMKNDTPICFCFRLDKEQTDKISFLKFAEIDDEKTIGDYNLSEENAGIYLPD